MTTALKKQADDNASRLSVKQRIEFAERVMAGVNDFANEEVAREWDREIKRRLDDYRSGNVKAIPSARVHAELNRRLNEIKARRVSSRRAA